MNIYEQKLAASQGIARIMGNKWAPVLAPPKEGGEGGGEGEGEGEGEGDGEGEEDAAEAARVAAAETARLAAEAAKKAKPTDAEAKLIKDIGKAKTARQAAETALAEANAKLAKFEGVDPEKAKEAQKAATKAEEDRLRAAGDFDRLKAMMAEEHKTEKTALEARVKEADDKLVNANRVIDDLTIGRAFSDSTFVVNDLILTPRKARVQFGSHFAMEEGEVVGYDKPEGSKNRTKLVDSNGDALDFEKALKKIIDADDEKDTLLKSKMKDGAGSGTENGKNKNAKDNKDGKTELRGAARIAANLKANQGKIKA